MNDNLKGIGLMVLAMTGFVGNDAIIKLVGTHMPLGQLLFVRGLMATALIVLVVKLFGQKLRVPRAVLPWLSVRLAGELVTTFGFLTALMNMQLANATALLQFTPIAVTFAAIMVFGEEVGWRRWTAIIVGLIGVMIIVRPGLEGFTIYSFFVLAAVIGSTFRDIATRKLPKSVHNLTITAHTSAIITVMGLVMMLTSETPIEPTNRMLIELAASSLFLLLGYFCIAAAMRQGDLAVVTPFRYVIFPMAIILGFTVFGEIPDFWTILGGSIIVASGIVTVVRNIQKRA